MYVRTAASLPLSRDTETWEPTKSPISRENAPWRVVSSGDTEAGESRATARCDSASRMAIPGKLTVPQAYNDTFRGWPVRPQKRQHPIRGSFLDPRPDPERGAIYHDGVDIAVRDDRPERGAPAGRTHRVFAIEGGPVFLATPRGTRGTVHVGHFRYGHVDAVVQVGEIVAPGQHIAWTCEGDWHVHLGETIFTADSGRILVNPLRPGGKLQPFVDRARPEIREVRFFRPATPEWARRPNTSVARLPTAGERLDRNRLTGLVDVRARVADTQSFIGWFEELPWLAAPHHPFRLAVRVLDANGRVVRRREVFRAEQLLGMSAGRHYAPGTEQNLPARGCMARHSSVRCDGIYWFRLFPLRYWDTTKLPDGRYRLEVRAWSVTGNSSRAAVDVRIANGV